jgi:branched-chain amino acid aminotransferase
MTTVTDETTDWSALGFGYRQTPYRFHAEWRDGAWSDGELVEDPYLHIEEGACGLHYGQQCFEGLKAYRGPDGHPLLFRVDQNAARMHRSAERLLMPPVSEALFIRAVEACVWANREQLPPHGSGASLYVRPMLIGVGENLGLRPAPCYIFRVFCSPVGAYFQGGLKGIRLLVTDHDRVAPRGTGAYKVGGNYAAGLLLAKEAKAKGYNEVLYLDALERRYLDEAGSANVYGILSGDPATFVTPLSDSILPSITMSSMLALAEDRGLKVERRQVPIEEVATFSEMGCTGTAAVVTPVAQITHGEVVYDLPAAPGPITSELYDQLTQIQVGARPDPHGWVRRVNEG